MTNLCAANVRRLACGAILATLLPNTAQASATYYYNYASWAADMGGTPAKLNFKLDGSMQLLSEQYAEFGTHFVEGSATTWTSGEFIDSWGMYGFAATGYSIPVSFDGLQYGIALRLALDAKVRCYLDDTLVFESSPLYVIGGSKFRAFKIDVPFNNIVIGNAEFNGSPGIDDLYVANPIPAPAALLVVPALLGVGVRRRR
jgi:hypothetical protein